MCNLMYIKWMNLSRQLGPTSLLLIWLVSLFQLNNKIAILFSIFFSFWFTANSICTAKSPQWGFWVEIVIVCLCLGRQNALLCIFISPGISLCAPSYRAVAAEMDAHSSMFVSRTAVTDTLWLAPCRSSEGWFTGDTGCVFVPAGPLSVYFCPGHPLDSARLKLSKKHSWETPQGNAIL